MDLEHRADQTSEVEVRKEKRSQATRLVIGVLVAAGLLAFVVQNSDEVSLHWLFFSFQWPMWLMMLVVIAITLVLAKAVGFLFRRRQRNAKDAKDSKR